MIGIMVGPQFDAVLAPRRGSIPDCVGRWWPHLQVQWFAKYLAALQMQHEALSEWQRPSLQLDTYYVTSVRHKGLCCTTCVLGMEVCPDAPKERMVYDCCHNDHTLQKR